MIPFRALMLAVVTLLTQSGCAYRNNYPQSVSFPIVTGDPEALHLYVDANGTFFPNGWKAKCPGGCKKLKQDFSLLVQSLTAPTFRSQIVGDEARQLEMTKAYLARHPRIFILVHGFNSDEREIRHSYALVRKRIRLEPGDGIIEFFWDGLVTVPAKRKLNLAPLKFWKDAAVNSQTGGARGLRRILALAQGKTFFLISHSRGASVVLSALSDPPYGAKFVKRMEQRDLDPNDGIDGSPGFLTPTPLASGNANQIKILMLAPAIGCIDFQRPEFERRRAQEMSRQKCSNVRPLPPEVNFFGYTVNENDSVLGKFILPSTWYSATDFGYKSDLGDALQMSENWSFMKPYPLKNLSEHDFDCYAVQNKFGDMLTDADASIDRTPDFPLNPKCGIKPKPQRKP